LYSRGGFISSDGKTYDLPWFPANHCHYIDIFSGFRARLAFRKSV
jgi:hypothetical protein